MRLTDRLTIQAMITVCAIGAVACGSSDNATPNPSTAAAALDACALLTADEIAATTGMRPVRADTQRLGAAAGCNWMIDDPYPNYPIVSAILIPGAAETWEAFTQSLIDGELGPILDDGERVDIGRFGVYGQRQLVVSTRSDRTLMLSVKSPAGAKIGKETTLAVARDLLARLP